MDKPKLTIDQLKNYLGTSLKCHTPSIDADYRRDTNVPVEFEMIGIVPDYLTIDCEALQTDVAIEVIKPICYRLSDLDKFIPELGFVPIEKLLQLIHQTWYNSHLDSRYSEIEIDSSEYYVKAYFKYMATLEINIRINGLENEKWWIIQHLFQWHFWPFGDEYFEAGLVIDKLKLQDHA